MFDPKVLLDALVAGSAAQRQPQQHGSQTAGGLGDLLGRLGQAAQQGEQPQAQAAPRGGAGGQGFTSLDELLGRLGQASQQAQRPQAASGQTPGSSGGGLGDILGDILGKLSQGAQQAGQAAQQAGRQARDATGAQGGVGDILGQIFGQAKEGVREGAGRINDATGASQKLDEILRQIAGGQGTPELVQRLKDLVASNQLGAGAVIGGLGALILGTRTGRGLAMDAAKLGGLVLIGGLAYKAYQNYSQGRPVLGGAAASQPPQPAPLGSGFEAQAQSGEAALLYIRAMIAAAAADGEIDRDEQQNILGGLKQVGLGEAASRFLQQELQNPATVEELVASCTSPEAALQVYTAARVAIEPDTLDEQRFLSQLASGLGIDAQLAAHIDAQASGLKS